MASKLSLKAADMLSWVLLVIAIIFALWYIFGNYPTLEQTLLAALTVSIIKLHASFGKVRETLGEVKGKIEEHLRNHK